MFGIKRSRINFYLESDHIWSPKYTLSTLSHIADLVFMLTFYILAIYRYTCSSLKPCISLISAYTNILFGLTTQTFATLIYRQRRLWRLLPLCCIASYFYKHCFVLHFNWKYKPWQACIIYDHLKNYSRSLSK